MRQQETQYCHPLIRNQNARSNSDQEDQYPIEHLYAWSVNILDNQELVAGTVVENIQEERS